MPHGECSLCLLLSRQFEWELKLKKVMKKIQKKLNFKISKFKISLLCQDFFELACLRVRLFN